MTRKLGQQTMHHSLVTNPEIREMVGALFMQCLASKAECMTCKDTINLYEPPHTMIVCKPKLSRLTHTLRELSNHSGGS